MSFGDGDLHKENQQLRDKCDMYKRQLGGMQAAYNRAKQRVDEANKRINELEGYSARLMDKIDHLKDVNGELANTINKQYEQIRKLEAQLKDNETGVDK